jgi:hypothetical protein
MGTRRMLVVFAASAALLFGFSSLAAAAPVNNPNAEFFTVECAGEEFEVVAMGPVGHVQGVRGVGVLMVGTVSVFVVDVMVDQETFFSRGRGLKGLVTCNWELEPEESVRLEFEGQVLFAPRSG